MAAFLISQRGLPSAGAAALFTAALLALAPGTSPMNGTPLREDAVKTKRESWPMLGGSVSRNLVNLFDTNIPTTWSLKAGAEKNLKWSVPLGSKAYGGPIISGGKIFVGTNNATPRDPKIAGDKGVLMCFRESDGEFLWQYVADKLEAGRVNDWPNEGIASSPVVEGDRLWFVSNRCEIVCLTTEGLAADNKGVKDEKYHGKTDADVIWRLDMMRDLGVFPHNLATCSPLIIGDALFVVTSNGVDEKHKYVAAPKAPSFLAVDKNTGKVLWSNNDPGDKIMHSQWSSPVYAEPNGRPMIIFPGGDGWIRGFNPKNGDLLWKFDCNPKKSFYELGPKATRNDFLATPVICDDKLYIGVGQDPEHGLGVGHLWCIDVAKEPKNADKDVSPVDDNFDPKYPKNKDSALVWHYGGEAPDDSDYPADFYFGRTISACCVKDGLVYAAEYAGYLHCLDAQTGKEYWVHGLKAQTWNSPFWVDGKVYLGDDSGKITVFEPGKEKKILAVNENVRRCKVEWGNIVAANGVLYFATLNPCKLWAISNP